MQRHSSFLNSQNISYFPLTNAYQKKKKMTGKIDKMCLRTKHMMLKWKENLNIVEPCVVIFTDRKRANTYD